jgi:hypothetical protein
MAWCIYKHTNKTNGKVYIGQTCQKPERRWQNGKGYEGSPKFWSAICEFGWDGFAHEIIEADITTQELANIREQFWISYYNSYENGYNATLGGTFEEVEVICIEDCIVFNSLSDCARAYNILTQNLSVNCCKNHKTLKGKHFAYLSEWLLGNWEPAEPYDTERRKEVSSLKKPVWCYQTKEFYDSATKAAILLGLDIRLVCRACSGELIQTGGYNFCWATDWYEGWEPRKSKQGQHQNGFSEEAKEKMRATALRNKGVRVAQYTKNGELLAIYANYQEGEDATGVKKDNIGRAVRTNRARTEKFAAAGPYVWREYTEQGEENGN